MENVCVAKATLQARPALDNYHFELNGFCVTEMPDTALLSIGFSPADSSKANKILSERFSVVVPPVGNSVSSTNYTLLALQRDQYWLLCSDTSINTTEVCEQLTANSLCITDQSDGWALLELKGEHCCAVLERLCALDIDEAVFNVGQLARTSIEHINTVLLRSEINRFLVLTPRSSAHSFVHAFEHTAKHVDNEYRVRAK